MDQVLALAPELEQTGADRRGIDEAAGYKTEPIRAVRSRFQGLRGAGPKPSLFTGSTLPTDRPALCQRRCV